MKENWTRTPATHAGKGSLTNSAGSPYSSPVSVSTRSNTADREEKLALRRDPIPVIDLFAGPGGLCEGFSSVVDGRGGRRFAVRVSIEKDPVAHKTLSLRALFRSFPQGSVPDCYYDYVRGAITREELFAHPDIPESAIAAANEAKCAELGKTPTETIDKWITEGLNGASEWVLIGGPPCQAYSLAGRSKMRMADPVAFEGDKRHFLYKEYLRIIKEFGPSVFVMENVKGMLTSKHGGSLIFEKILADLKSPGNGREYRIRSFIVPGEALNPNDYVIQSENFGIPQNRHRVILFGIRSDLVDSTPTLESDPRRFLLTPHSSKVSVRSALSGLPPLRSRLSREVDSDESWLAAMKGAPLSLKLWRAPMRMEIELAMGRALEKAAARRTSGAKFLAKTVTTGGLPTELKAWIHDAKLGGVLQHEARSHMRSDLHRYLFASCFAALNRYSPKLTVFPPKLVPDHGNMADEAIPFLDRFRVQVSGDPSSTVVAHIAKDGHYYIHFDPSQCRSLTVREAARLQTFPDNYFFEGNRTQQYGQVGNAVPPLLARKVAEVVFDFIKVSRR
jgi:DNA (cytosine-5)-methyltransferase 1